MTEYRSELQKIRKEVRAQINTVMRLCEQDVEFGINMEVGVEDFAESGNNVRTRLCSLDSPIVTVLNITMGNQGKLPLFKTSRIVSVFVVEGSIVDLQSGKGTHEGQVYTIAPNKLFEIRSDYASLVITFKPAFNELTQPN